MTQMKRWKGIAGPGWGKKVCRSFVAALGNLSIVGGSMCVENGGDHVKE
jgi:hypothetical protein